MSLAILTVVVLPFGRGHAPPLWWGPARPRYPVHASDWPSAPWAQAEASDRVGPVGWKGII